MDDYALLELFDVTVVAVPHLKDEACFVRDQRVALIRPGLAPAVRDQVLDWLLHRATATAETSPS